MQIRPATIGDLESIAEIDGVLQSEEYLHLDQSGQGLNIGWRLERRPLRNKLIESNPISDEVLFALKQIATGADEGIAVLAEHDSSTAGLLIAQPRHELGALEILDLRIDFDHRRQGLATAMLFQTINFARDNQFRAVIARTRTNNFPANQLLLKTAFDLSGVDTRRISNHDLVKEVATLIWYASLD